MIQIPYCYTNEPWQGITWEQRWRKWNLVYPDFARPTPGALRKAWEYAVNNREKIQARINKLNEVPKLHRDSLRTGIHEIVHPVSVRISWLAEDGNC